MSTIRKYRAAIILTALITITLLLTLVWRVDNTKTLRWAHVYEISTPYHQQTLKAAREFEGLFAGQ